MTKIKIAAVSYLNTKPFLYGLQHSSIKEKIDLQTYIPSVCADKLLNGEADLGLIPVAVIPQLKEFEIISDYCIGAVGAVSSVLILSEVPMEKIKKIYLDYQSRTSVALAQILLKDYWKRDVQSINAASGYENKISGTAAGVVIGDRALQLKSKFNFVYDLALAWHQHTKLPFVFACWVSNKKLPGDFIHEFNVACKFGIEHIDDLITELKHEKDFYPDSKNYLNNFISYNLDDEKRSGLKLFLEMLSN
ncbi:MAG: menaquinone biosynthesis protein [Bacteroidia bacterium]